MNLLFCAAPKDVYAFLTTEAYPMTFAPFPLLIPDVPDFSKCTDENKRTTVRAKHMLDKKMRANIITMNIALTNVFLDYLSSQVCTSFQQRCLCKPNIIFIEMFIWFINHYGKTTSKDCEANCQRMAANWQSADGFDVLLLRLFSNAAFTGCTSFAMNDHNIVDIGLCMIKCCGMYAKEYKAWIACEAIRPNIIKNLDSIKTFWSAKIIFVNQTATPVSLHGYGMAAVNNNNASVELYGNSIANFEATYAATQVSVRSHSLTIMSLEGQLNAMQQYCMTIQQQLSPTNYTVQQQHGPNNCHGSSRQNEGNGGGRTGYQQPGQQPTNGMRAPLHPPTPYKCYKNCHTHGGDVDEPRAPSLAQCTTPKQPAPTSWADQWWECIKPFCSLPLAVPHRLPAHRCNAHPSRQCGSNPCLPPTLLP